MLPASIALASAEFTKPKWKTVPPRRHHPLLRESQESASGRFIHESELGMPGWRGSAIHHGCGGVGDRMRDLAEGFRAVAAGEVGACGWGNRRGVGEGRRVGVSGDESAMAELRRVLRLAWVPRQRPTSSLPSRRSGLRRRASANSAASSREPGHRPRRSEPTHQARHAPTPATVDTREPALTEEPADSATAPGSGSATQACPISKDAPRSQRLLVRRTQWHRRVLGPILARRVRF